MTITGANIIAGEPSSDGEAAIRGVDPRRGESLDPAAHEATTAEVERACAAAAEAAAELAGATGERRAELLDATAAALEEDRPDILAVADEETALGAEPRLAGELTRTTDQLRFLGEVARDGAVLGVTIDRPAEGPVLRRMRVPVGPVAVFGASNFPLAFSVAGGDTAAALAAGCPALVKAHPAHPRTSELVGRAVARGIEAAGGPPGAFSLLHGFAAGRRLVLDPVVAAVAFTGSQAGGRALEELATERDQPVPVYAEMGSVNPVVITPGAARRRPGEIAAGFVGSFTLGSGQFCTKPGLLFVPSGTDLPGAVAARVAEDDAAPLLTADIAARWRERTAAWIDHDAVDVLAGAGNVHPEGEQEAGPVVLATDPATLAGDPDLLEECFGPTALLIRWGDAEALVAALEAVPGSLAGGIHATDGETALARRVMAALEPRVGRLLFDGWPTGVAVTWAMHHGGPRPATTAPRETSVGAAAVERFLRPVCYQGVPQALLPEALHDDNPLGLPRRVDGSLQVPDG